MANAPGSTGGVDAIEAMLARVRAAELPPEPPAPESVAPDAEPPVAAPPVAVRPLWSGPTRSRSRLGWLASRWTFGFCGLLLGFGIAQLWQLLQVEQGRSEALVSAGRSVQELGLAPVLAPRTPATTPAPVAPSPAPAATELGVVTPPPRLAADSGLPAPPPEVPAAAIATPPLQVAAVPEPPKPRPSKTRETRKKAPAAAAPATAKAPDSPGARCRNAPSGQFRRCVEQQCLTARFSGHRQCAAVGLGG